MVTGKRSASRAAEPEQLVLFKKRGGKRRGAGRPPMGPSSVAATWTPRQGWACPAATRAIRSSRTSLGAARSSRMRSAARAIKGLVAVTAGANGTANALVLNAGVFSQGAEMRIGQRTFDDGQGRQYYLLNISL